MAVTSGVGERTRPLPHGRARTFTHRDRHTRAHGRSPSDTLEGKVTLKAREPGERREPPRHVGRGRRRRARALAAPPAPRAPLSPAPARPRDPLPQPLQARAVGTRGSGGWGPRRAGGLVSRRRPPPGPASRGGQRPGECGAGAGGGGRSARPPSGPLTGAGDAASGGRPGVRGGSGAGVPAPGGGRGAGESGRPAGVGGPRARARGDEAPGGRWAPSGGCRARGAGVGARGEASGSWERTSGPREEVRGRARGADFSAKLGRSPAGPAGRERGRRDRAGRGPGTARSARGQRRGMLRARCHANVAVCCFWLF